MWAAILKTSAVSQLEIYKFSRDKDKNKIKRYEQKAISV